MTDLTDYNIDLDAEGSSSGGGKLKEGRYNLDYAGSEIIEGANGWVALKLHFEIHDTTINVATTFTLKHDTSEKAVEIGADSLRRFAKACGLSGAFKNADKELMGKSVSCELKHNEKGYLDIADNFGNAWQPATTNTSQPNGEEKVEAVDETVPF